YLLRNGDLAQVTVDHTMAGMMAEAGKMSRDEARRTPMGHALWNAIGGKSEDLSVDVYRLSLECDDLLLLCTDGLYDLVPDEKLREILNAGESAESTCRKLANLANENGGNDNITVIVSRFQSPQLDEGRAFVEAEVPLAELTSHRAAE